MSITDTLIFSHWHLNHSCHSTQRNSSSPTTTNKVNVPNSVTFLDRFPIFEWCVIRCRSKKEHQNNMCLKEIRLHAQNLLTTLGSIVNTIVSRGGGRLQEHIMAPALLTF